MILTHRNNCCAIFWCSEKTLSEQNYNTDYKQFRTRKRKCQDLKRDPLRGHVVLNHCHQSTWYHQQIWDNMKMEILTDVDQLLRNPRYVNYVLYLTLLRDLNIYEESDIEIVPCVLLSFKAPGRRIIPIRWGRHLWSSTTTTRHSPTRTRTDQKGA